uniref:Uncharacterized protein n=1 Tax=Oryza barthii TaxID=65489 RepID=A0A0D3FSP2_9ORYZ
MSKPNPRAASSSAAAAVSSPDAGRKEREENTVPAVYDASADIEDDYRLFLENVRVYENEDFVLEYEGKVVRYGGDEAVSAGGGSRGEDPVMEEEKEKEKEVDVVVISSSSDDESTKIVSEPNPLDRGVFQRKMKKVVDKEKMDEKNEAAAPLVKGKGVGKVIGMEVEDEQLVLALPKPGTTTSLTNPSKRHETEPYTTSRRSGWGRGSGDGGSNELRHRWRLRGGAASAAARAEGRGEGRRRRLGRREGVSAAERTEGVGIGGGVAGGGRCGSPNSPLPQVYSPSAARNGGSGNGDTRGLWIRRWRREGAADPATETDPVMSVFFLAVMVVVFFVVMEVAARPPSGGGGGTAPLPSLSLDHALPDLADGRWQWRDQRGKGGSGGGNPHYTLVNATTHGYFGAILKDDILSMTKSATEHLRFVVLA